MTGLRNALAFLLLSLCCTAVFAQSQALVSGFNANTLPPNDDGSAGPVPLGFDVNLFGVTVNQLFVNNNGNVTFDAPLGAFTPFPLLSTEALIVAPYFADVDTRNAGNPVTFGSGTFNGRPAFGVNWLNVDYFSSTTAHSNRNSFQLILVGRSDRRAGDFDIVFNYGSITWETGEFSGGDVNGRGGNSARVGYAIGRGAPGSALELAGSAINGAFLNGGPNALVSGSRGSGIPGRYVFEIRGADATAQVGALTPFANAPSAAPMTSANGRFVVFETFATNLLDGSPQGVSQILLVDTQTGIVRRISVDNAGTPFNGDAREPAVSNDGSFVAFVAPQAAAQKLYGESKSQRERRLKGSGSAVFMRNLLTGTTQMAAPAAAAGSGTAPALSSTGNALVLTRETTSAGQGQIGQSNIYIVPLIRNGNTLTPGPERCVSCKAVDVNGNETGTNVNGGSSKPSVSANGVWVAYQTTAKNTVAGTPAPCPNSGSDMVLRNMLTGVMRQVSAPPAGGSCGAAGASSSNGQLDESGLRLAFASDQPLIGGDGNGASDVFVFDVAEGELQRVSQAPAGGNANGASTQPTMSGDGRFVGFVSTATNLDPSSSDTNGVADLHVVEIDVQQTQRLALTDGGLQIDAAQSSPSFNFDGSRMSFETASGNVAAGAVPGQTGVFFRANPLALPSGDKLSATWWDPSESGWGVFTVDQGTLATGWFTYDTDGEPTWFLLTPSVRGTDGSYSGNVERYTGVPFDRTPGNAAESLVLRGQGSVRFSGSDQLSLTYTVDGTTQTKSLSRFQFGASELRCTPSPTASRATATNFSDLWWGGVAGSTGWGLHISHVDNSLFATWYTYDSDREPIFLIAATTRQPNGSFTGPLLRQPSGTPLLQINGQPAAGPPAQVGTATLSFSNGETGVFATVLDGQTQSKPITRLQVGPVVNVCATVAPTR